MDHNTFLSEVLCGGGRNIPFVPTPNKPLKSIFCIRGKQKIDKYDQFFWIIHIIGNLSEKQSFFEYPENQLRGYDVASSVYEWTDTL